MTQPPPTGYLGSDARITVAPATELVASGFAAETGDAGLLHRGLALADLAHLIALHESGIIPADSTRSLAAVLLETLDMPADDFPYRAAYGDAYNSREHYLESRLGKVAGWIHTGRTRREAGRIAFRFAFRERLLKLHGATADFVAALNEEARTCADFIWADTTYLQPAQPSTFGHYFGAFAEEAMRHLDRIQHAYELINLSPAGAGGVGGSRIPIDRHRLAELLGFPGPGAHTRDAMWSTDTVAEAVVAATLAATTADRLAEDLEIFTSPGFSYVELDASLCRASVLMPQKRNPYALAVIRADAGTLIGRSTGLLVTGRTPSARTDNWLNTYREACDAIDMSTRVMTLGAAVVRTLTVHPQALRTMAGQNFTQATDVAEELVLRAGIDYRSAYRIVGAALTYASEEGRSAIAAEDLAVAGERLFGVTIELDRATLENVMDPASIIAGRAALGGSSPARVIEHADGIAARLSSMRTWREARIQESEAAEHTLRELVADLVRDSTADEAERFAMRYS